MAIKRKKLAAPIAGVLLAGLAAFAYYRYSRLTAEQKETLVGNLKERGRKLLGQVTKKQSNGLQEKGVPQVSEYLA